jgi:hypothetical protein
MAIALMLAAVLKQRPIEPPIMRMDGIDWAASAMAVQKNQRCSDRFRDYLIAGGEMHGKPLCRPI